MTARHAPTRRGHGMGEGFRKLFASRNAAVILVASGILALFFSSGYVGYSNGFFRLLNYKKNEQNFLLDPVWRTGYLDKGCRFIYHGKWSMRVKKYLPFLVGAWRNDQPYGHWKCFEKGKMVGETVFVNQPGVDLNWEWPVKKQGSRRGDYVIGVPDSKDTINLYERETKNGWIEYFDDELNLVWSYSSNGRRNFNSWDWQFNNGIFYLVRWSSISTGCAVFAFDLKGKKLLWKKHPCGLGALGHSCYLNSTSIKMHEGRVCIYGDESAGRYIEALDPETGRRIGHKIIKYDWDGLKRPDIFWLPQDDD